jgi:hypothetical protein
MIKILTIIFVHSYEKINVYKETSVVDWYQKNNNSSLLDQGMYVWEQRHINTIITQREIIISRQ